MLARARAGGGKLRELYFVLSRERGAQRDVETS